MLPGEQGLPEEIFSYHSNIVNHVVQFVCKESDAYLADRVRRLIRALQLRWYRRSRRQIFCPSCGVNEHTRKGWRPRVLRSSRGRLVLLVLQAKCKCCGRAFRPFTQALGLPFSRRCTDELIEKALGYSYEGLERTLDSHIKNLRRKIEDDPGEPRYIETVFGVGYRFREAES